MNVIISIDGACRRNGKPDCLAAGAVYVHNEFKSHTILENEMPSTNQRGEMLAAIEGLAAGYDLMEQIGSDITTVYLITDSEYIFNAITKEWYKGWSKKGWVTADNNPVKNKDLWMQIASEVDKYDSNEQLVVYHVKGHLISIGKVAAETLIRKDPTCRSLVAELSKIYDAMIANPLKREAYDKAIELFERNNGFVPPADIFKKMIICNMVSDAVATKYINELDAQD